MNALEELVGIRAALGSRAQNGYLVTVGLQRPGLIPHTGVKWHRNIFDDNENFFLQDAVLFARQQCIGLLNARGISRVLKCSVRCRLAKANIDGSRNTQSDCEGEMRLSNLATRLG